jgi:hypothetical protein
MSLDVREYSITYAVKNLLLENNWDVIAYNPPGSQGTFTIPNPSKDGAYRGQTGSESPDIIAVKKNLVLIVECKPAFDTSDAEKLTRLSSNWEKMEILTTLIKRVCAANSIQIPETLNYIFALAYQGKKHSIKDLGYISVEVSTNIDITHLKAKSSYEDSFKAQLFPASLWEASVLALLEN